MFDKNLTIMVFRPKNRPFLGQNRKNEPTVFWKPWAIIYSNFRSISQKTVEISVSEEKICFADNCALRKNIKSRNLAIFLVLRGTKYVQSFEAPAAVVLKIDRGSNFFDKPSWSK